MCNPSALAGLGVVTWARFQRVTNPLCSHETRRPLFFFSHAVLFVCRCRATRPPSPSTPSTPSTPSSARASAHHHDGARGRTLPAGTPCCWRTRTACRPCARRALRPIPSPRAHGWVPASAASPRARSAGVLFPVLSVALRIARHYCESCHSSRRLACVRTALSGRPRVAQGLVRRERPDRAASPGRWPARTMPGAVMIPMMTRQLA